MGLQFPATSGDLVFDNVTIPSGYANYFIVAHQQLANSGELLKDFLVRQVVFQSVERYKKLLIEQNYESIIASGNTIQSWHRQFVTDITSEEQSILDNY